MHRFPGEEPIRLEPRLWERLRRELQDIYREATGEQTAALKVEIGEY